MVTGDFWVLFAMLLYFIMVVIIGFIYAKKSNRSTEEYFLGGRSLGPWLTALSAEASDMSGYLLMGLPGLAYFCGANEAVWTAIGLAIGTYLNWKFVANACASIPRLPAMPSPSLTSSRIVSMIRRTSS